jgi:hypothetical protein
VVVISPFVSFSTTMSHDDSLHGFGFGARYIACIESELLLFGRRSDSVQQESLQPLTAGSFHLVVDNCYNFVVRARRA